MTININNLVFWLLIRIYSTPGLVDQIRTQIAAFAKATQPVQSFGIPEPPLLVLNAEGLSSSCPLLKACFHECLRQDTSAVSILSVCKDMVITTPREDLFGAERSASYCMKAGEMVAVALRMCHCDPQDFKFSAERFLLKNKPGIPQTVIDLQYRLPYDDDDSMLPKHKVTESVILAFVAGILALWDIEPLRPGRWVMPSHHSLPAFHDPVKDVKVRVRRRSLV